jgi:hypothetical protein
MNPRARPRPSEASLGPPVERYLSGLGYRVWIDPDGSGFLDMVAMKDEEVGLVELKVSDWKTVLVQAVRRRAWGDWVAVALPRWSLAQKVIERRSAGRAARVGVWWIDDGELRVLRPARVLYDPGEPDPFSVPRGHFRELLQHLAAGRIEPGYGWDLAVHAARATHRRRPALEWTLEEFPDSVG